MIVCSAKKLINFVESLPYYYKSDGEYINRGTVLSAIMNMSFETDPGYPTVTKGCHFSPKKRKRAKYKKL